MATPVPMNDTAPASVPTRSALAWLWLSLALIALDQWTKHLAVAHLTYRVRVPVVPGFWDWNLTHNTGAAFSFLADAGGWQHLFFVALGIGVSGLLAFWLGRTARGDWRTAAPFALMIAGALGNVVDRLRFGYVVDFIHWYWRGFDWPVFNVADSCIVVGAVMMVLFTIRPRRAGG
jgi:signal peptidase II